MRIAILSDVHDNIWKLETLMAGLEADALIFCGDFCAPFTLAQIAEAFAGPVHVVFGNNDGDQFFLSQVASKFAHVTLHGDFAELEFEGRRVAVTHYPQIGKALAQGGFYDLVCHGHSHERLVEVTGETLRVNPGEVMGRFGLSTFAMYDAATAEVEIIEVPEEGRS
jgi:putative phosphoesterase